MSDFDIVQDTPIEQLGMILDQLTPDQRIAAKNRLRSNKAVLLEAEAAKWRHDQMPENMQKPMAVRIKQWNGAAIVGSWEFANCRKMPGYTAVRPGEVVVVDLANPVMRKSFEKGYLEVTHEQATRPLLYADSGDAQLMDPMRGPRIRVPDAHRQEALEATQTLVAEIRRQYEETKNFVPERDPTLPPTARVQALETRIRAEVEAEIAAEQTGNPVKAEVETEKHPDGEPVKNAEGTPRRKRVVVPTEPAK